MHLHRREREQRRQETVGRCLDDQVPYVRSAEALPGQRAEAEEAASPSHDAAEAGGHRRGHCHRRTTPDPDASLKRYSWTITSCLKSQVVSGVPTPAGQSI